MFCYKACESFLPELALEFTVNRAFRYSFGPTKTCPGNLESNWPDCLPGFAMKRADLVIQMNHTSSY